MNACSCKWHEFNLNVQMPCLFSWESAQRANTSMNSLMCAVSCVCAANIRDNNQKICRYFHPNCSMCLIYVQKHWFSEFHAYEIGQTFTMHIWLSYTHSYSFICLLLCRFVLDVITIVWNWFVDTNYWILMYL